MIYMDNAATTAVAGEVLETMLPFFREEYGNASTLYDFGRRAKIAVEEARMKAAAVIGADDRGIFFTGCGTEGDNWALKGSAEMLADKGRHIITSKIEHHAILHSCAWLEKAGFEVTYMDVDSEGFVDPDALKKAIRRDTILVSIMTANNETGTIEPITELGAIAHEHGILFHTDAVQAYGHIPIDVEKDNIDLLSTSAHKLNGPKGVGFLYVKRGISLPSFMHGGAQETGHRAGTENVAGIAGYGKACEIANEKMEERNAREARLRDRMLERILDEIPGVTLNGPRSRRLPNNINICIEGMEGGNLLYGLSRAGICASAGSACSSGSAKPSHVLTALGVDPALALSSLRLTLGHETTDSEADYCVDVLKQTVMELRNRK